MLLWSFLRIFILIINYISPFGKAHERKLSIESVKKTWSKCLTAPPPETFCQNIYLTRVLSKGHCVNWYCGASAVAISQSRVLSWLLIISSQPFNYRPSIVKWTLLPWDIFYPLLFLFSPYLHCSSFLGLSRQIVATWEKFSFYFPVVIECLSLARSTLSIFLWNYYERRIRARL